MLGIYAFPACKHAIGVLYNSGYEYCCSEEKKLQLIGLIASLHTKIKTVKDMSDIITL